jgi:hypothetical protein
MQKGACFDYALRHMALVRAEARVVCAAMHGVFSPAFETKLDIWHASKPKASSPEWFCERLIEIGSGISVNKWVGRDPERAADSVMWNVKELRDDLMMYALWLRREHDDPSWLLRGLQNLGRLDLFLSTLPMQSPMWPRREPLTTLLCAGDLAGIRDYLRLHDQLESVRAQPDDRYNRALERLLRKPAREARSQPDRELAQLLEAPTSEKEPSDTLAAMRTLACIVRADDLQLTAAVAEVLESQTARNLGDKALAWRAHALWALARLRRPQAAPPARPRGLGWDDALASALQQGPTPSALIDFSSVSPTFAGWMNEPPAFWDAFEFVDECVRTKAAPRTHHLSAADAKEVERLRVSDPEKFQLEHFAQRPWILAEKVRTNANVRRLFIRHVDSLADDLKDYGVWARFTHDDARALHAAMHMSVRLMMHFRCHIEPSYSGCDCLHVFAIEDALAIADFEVVTAYLERIPGPAKDGHPFTIAYCNALYMALQAAQGPKPAAAVRATNKKSFGKYDSALIEALACIIARDADGFVRQAELLLKSYRTKAAQTSVRGVLGVLIPFSVHGLCVLAERVFARPLVFPTTRPWDKAFAASVASGRPSPLIDFTTKAPELQRWIDELPRELDIDRFCASAMR